MCQIKRNNSWLCQISSFYVKQAIAIFGYAHQKSTGYFEVCKVIVKHCTSFRLTKEKITQNRIL